jgi:hypothetical protein
MVRNTSALGGFTLGGGGEGDTSVFGGLLFLARNTSALGRLTLPGKDFCIREFKPPGQVYFCIRRVYSWGRYICIRKVYSSWPGILLN